MKKYYLFFAIILSMSQMGQGACVSSATILTNVSTSSLSSPYSTANGQFGNATVRIEGTLTVNSDFTFYDAHILMAPNAKIIINADKKLILDKVRISSCDGINMWDGIELSAASNMSSTPISLEVKGGSLIEDAVVVVWLQASNGVKVIDSQLNKNVTGIQIDIGAQNSTLEVYGVLFSCRGTYNNPSTAGNVLLAPFPGNRSHEGIDLYPNSNTFSIGSSSQTANTFENIQEGIATQNANTTKIKNNVFLDCGVGVLANAFAAVEIGGSGNQSNKFYNGLVGISTSSCNAEIHHNEFFDAPNPIRCNSFNNNDVKIMNNEMWNFDIGIALGGHDAFSNAEVVENELNHIDDWNIVNNIGIICYPLTLPLSYQTNVSIRDNRISNCISSIVASQLLWGEISGNDIKIPVYIPSGSYYGIDLYRCEKTDISYNEVTKVSPNSSVIVEGIRGTDLTYANLIKGNSFTDLEITNMRGVHLYGNCAGLQMECNSFSDCDEAMFLGSVGQQVALSHQGTLNTATENNWYPYNSTYPYRIYSNVNPINWYYDNDNGVVFSNGKWPYSNDQNINLSGLSPQSELCGNPFSYNVLPERDIDPIIYETISFENDGAEHLYNLKSSLFQAFLNRDELDDNWMKDGDYNKWYEELYEGNIGLLERAEFIMASSTFEEKDEKAEDAYELFSSVTPNNRAEENKLVILNILHDNITIENYFNVLDSMDSADIDLIYEIAYQNSILGGEAVLWSRAMLNLFIMDEDPEPLARKKSIKNSTSQIQLALYPNPNHGTVNISSPEQCYLDIFDLRGTRIKRFENVVNNQNINLNLDNGFYFYRLTFVEGNISKTGTISVIK